MGIINNLKMRTYLLSLIAVAGVAATATRPVLFKVPILGWTDVDFENGAEGFASGVFHTDVRGQFDECLNGIPSMATEIYSTFNSLDILKNPTQVFKNFAK